MVGSRDDGTLVRVSAHVAHAYGLALLQLADHASRVDVQVTAATDAAGLHRRLLRHFRQAASHSREGRPIAVTLIDTRPRGTTVQLGKRQSDQIGRLYDKHVESKGRYPPGSLRAEVEYKGSLAESFHSRARRQAVAPADAATLVERWFRQRGVILGLADPRGADLAGPAIPNPDYQRALEWWRRGVQPGIRRWMSDSTRDEILAALGLAPDG